MIRDKNLKTATKIVRKMIKIGLSRQSCVVAIGGGGISDMSGFVASVYMRGIDFIQIPTTLMGQGDAIIGKVAVNCDNRKNAIGSFFSPKFVFCDTSYLDSLQKIHILYGLIEIWKHALLFNNYEIPLLLLGYLKENKTINWKNIIYFSLEIKRYFVEKDPYDINGLHKALSFGHTIANVLETKVVINHGLAVFYGIIFDSLLSKQSKFISQEKFNTIMKVAGAFEPYFNKKNSVAILLKKIDLLKVLSADKINTSSKYNFVVPTENSYMVYKNVSVYLIKKTLNDFCKLDLHN